MTQQLKHPRLSQQCMHHLARAINHAPSAGYSQGFAHLAATKCACNWGARTGGCAWDEQCDTPSACVLKAVRVSPGAHNESCQGRPHQRLMHTLPRPNKCVAKRACVAWLKAKKKEKQSKLAGGRVAGRNTFCCRAIALLLLLLLRCLQGAAKGGHTRIRARTHEQSDGCAHGGKSTGRMGSDAGQILAHTIND